MGSNNIGNLFAGATIGCITTLAVLGSKAIPQQVKADSATYRAAFTAIEPIAPAQDGKVVKAKVTAYCPCSKCCGAYSDGVTSRGRDAFKTRGVAVDPEKISYGSMVTIPGAGTFIADDTGGAMRQADGYHIDLRFPTHQHALNWGVQWLEVVIK